MDTQQLKRLAGCVRTLLADSHVDINHSQSLDLSAALVGLRNWPEVQAFPRRVEVTELDLTAAGRLAYRLEHKHGVTIAASALLERLRPLQVAGTAVVPEVWPTGPQSGVYLCTSGEAISALIARYQDATDGAVFFAEGAGASHGSAIDLGEWGLWSNGLARMPSGTLLVIGPVELDQQSWSNAGERLVMACLHAANSGHRIAVLVDTPAPESLTANATLLVRSEDDDDLHEYIVGTVSDDGDLVPGVDRAFTPPLQVPRIASTAMLGEDLRQRLVAALADRKAGILAVGSFADSDNPGADVAEAALALTDHLGPAARIMPRHRSTMSKYDQVPMAVRQLPFLPSVESAYAQGYRRFLIDPRYTKGETLERFVHDVLFIASTGATCVDELAMSQALMDLPATLVGQVLAAAAIVTVTGKQAPVQLVDLYIRSGPITLPDDEAAACLFPGEHRALVIEDQLMEQVKSGDIDMDTPQETTGGRRLLKRLRSMLETV